MPISLFGLFENVKPLVIAGSVTGLSSRMDDSHSLPLLQLSPCECRTCQGDVAHGRVLECGTEPGLCEKGRVIKYIPNVRSDWGRSAGVLYTAPTVLVLCGLQDGKKGCAAAQDEGLIQLEQHSVCA